MGGKVRTLKQFYAEAVLALYVCIVLSSHCVPLRLEHGPVVQLKADWDQGVKEIYR